LQFEELTPEKEFCKADSQQRKHYMKLGIALTTAINNNIDAKLIFDAMDITQNQEKKYNNFDELFDSVAISGILGEFKSQQDYVLLRSRYHFEFNVWLQEIKEWEYGDDLQYKRLLTVELFNEFFDAVRNKSIHQRNEQHRKTSEMEFDLKKYDLTTANVCPYFPEPKFDGNEYRIYEGATGNNRFQYFRFSKKSNAGKLCKTFIEKYYVKYEKRFEHYEDAEKLIEACKIDAVEKVDGLEAYLKYWNDCLTENDKLINNIYSIQHLEALKDWFNLTVQKHIQKNETLYLNADVKNADIEQFKENIADSVSQYLKQSERTDQRKFSAISKVQANELMKFYYWIVEQNEKAPANSKIKTEQLKRSPKINSYSIKQIAIAYSIMNILITSENAETILKEHSKFTSASKLLQKRINKVSELSKISENKTADTKHLKDLQAAKRLMSGMKNKNAINDIDRVIAAFTTAYKNKY